MMTWNACMLREIQPWLVVGLTYISFIDYPIYLFFALFKSISTLVIHSVKEDRKLSMLEWLDRSNIVIFLIFYVSFFLFLKVVGTKILDVLFF
jgi:hypothetical protein